ncbi:uncharacterized protein EKO05_0001811 [Ascochyta rabiei]|uniref:uncharacterized protein n=1 Tax=Didymella rabiei TaxID=5454 RepID=UPI0021FE37B1|nr:uncharacterized protein EKO05_0001811 [Ascochyta rabiei]UPX11190.1 hypothetical protein EKO05_0001811 [Ascochyta rabiei]
MVRFERFPQHDDRSSRFDARTLYQDHEKFAVSRDITFSSSAAMTSCTSVAANVGSNVNIENVSQWPKTVGQHPHVQEPLRLYPSVPLSHTPSVLSRQPRPFPAVINGTKFDTRWSGREEPRSKEKASHRHPSGQHLIFRAKDISRTQRRPSQEAAAAEPAFPEARVFCRK